MKYYFYDNITIIKNDKISLVNSYISDKNNIYELLYACFDIVLNESGDKVGNILFDYSSSFNFDYTGNLEYNIEEEYRNNGYATMALALLKELLKSNKFKGDKTLYVSMWEENKQSEKVAINNEGILYYEGYIPVRDSNVKESSKKVKIYKIKI